MLDCLKPVLLATGLSLTLATAPQAAVVSFYLDVSFVNGPLVGSVFDPFDLTVFYDENDLTDGTGFLGPDDGLEIESDGVNVEDLDVDYDQFPEVGFLDYIPVSINFLIDFETLSDLLDQGLLAVWISGDFAAEDLFNVIYDQANGRYSTFATVIELAPIPLPAGLPLLAGGLGLIALAARRRTRG